MKRTFLAAMLLSGMLALRPKTLPETLGSDFRVCEA